MRKTLAIAAAAVLPLAFAACSDDDDDDGGTTPDGTEAPAGDTTIPTATTTALT